MAKVTFQTADHELRREENGIYFWAKNKDGAVGTLVVSKGGLRWYDGEARQKHHFLSWEKAAQVFVQMGRAGK